MILKFNKHKNQIITIIICIVIICFLIYYFHGVLRTGIIVTHLFYIPIILASFWWKRKGLILALFLTGLLIFSNIFLRLNVNNLHDYIRACIFLITAVIVANISEQFAKTLEINKRTEKALQEAYNILEKRVENGTEKLSKSNALLKQQIKERKEINEKIKTFYSAMEQSIDGIVIIDLKKKIMYVNNAFAYMHGYTSDEMMGMEIKKIHNKKQMKECNNQIDQVKTNGSWMGEIGHINKNNISFLTYMSITLLKNNKGNPSGMLGVVRDITEQKKAEKKLEKAREFAKVSKYANQAKSVFLANMSHEIRTPMNAIMGITDILMDTNPTDEQQEYLEIINSSSNDLLKLLNDILDYSKIEAGKLDLEIIEFNLANTIKPAIDMLSFKAFRKDLEIIVDISEDIPGILIGAPMRLREIIINFMENAIKFTEKGEIVFRVKVNSISSDKVELHFSVQDTGIGIDKQQLKLIFKAFTQSDSSIKRRFGGTGLGTTISKKLAELMNGKVWVKSIHGSGSTFHFIIPFKFKKETLFNHFIKNLEIKGLNILVVDDNQTNRNVLKEMLSSLGINPVFVCDGKSALNKLILSKTSEEYFHIVLLDEQMPGMNGLMVMRKLREQGLLNQKIILMISPKDLKYSLSSYYQLGISACLKKPVYKSDLLNAINKVLKDIIEEEVKVKEKRKIKSIKKNNINSTILLVEDNEINQKVAITLLKKQGYQVIVADNGKIALEILNKEKESIDLILMDIMMPEMDGYAAAMAIREKEKETGKHIPIIALTAKAMKGDKEKCLKAGMDDYIAKPIKVANFIKVISRVIKGID